MMVSPKIPTKLFPGFLKSGWIKKMFRTLKTLKFEIESAFLNWKILSSF